MTAAKSWIRLDPVIEEDGTRDGWNLIVEFDPDWQGWRVHNRLQETRFEVYVTDDMVEGLNISEVAVRER